MILDAILLALRKIASTQKRDVAILREMRIGQGDGVQISHPVSGYELWLSGNVDYAVIEYENVMDNKGESEYQTQNCFTTFSDRLLLPGGSREESFEIAQGHLLLVQAKRQNLDQTLVSCIPEAVRRLHYSSLPSKSSLPTSLDRLIFWALLLQPSRGPFLSIWWADMDFLYFEVGRQHTDILWIGNTPSEQRRLGKHQPTLTQDCATCSWIGKLFDLLAYLLLQE